jgi:hypothetical protein
VGHADNLFRVVSAKQPLPEAASRACDEDLANLAPPRVFHHGPGNIRASKNLRLDPKVSRETKVFFDGLALGGWEIRDFGRFVNEQG